MNNKLCIFFLILIIASFFFGCGEAVPAENKNSATAGSVSPEHVTGEKYSIDTRESVLTWEGFMVLGFDEKHVGYVYTSKGELIIDKDQLVGGTVEVDMNTIEYGDKDNKNTPIKHLKSPDYFDVEKFPTSTFSITKVVDAGGGNIKVTGNLTLKGITKAVTFPANIAVKDGIVKSNGKVTIDRTQWGIRYASGKFYDNLADQAVSDDIEIHMKIAAKK
jgi:polyisoprenoid-binding protein YceI